MAERGATLAVISDYNRAMGDDDHWVGSSDGKCAVYVSATCDATIADQGVGIGFAWARVGTITVYSCYCSPNCSLQEFDLFLGGLEGSIRRHPVATANLIVAGDFNSHSPEWGSATSDARGAMLSDFASTLGLVVNNIGTQPTYRRVNASSVIDVTFTRAAPNSRLTISDWEVLNDVYSASDHCYIHYVFAFPVAEAAPPESAATRLPGWSIKKLNPDAANVLWNLAGPPRPLSADASAAEHAERLNNLLTATCEAAMPRRTVFRKRQRVHWWNDSIADLRKAAIAARRAYQRAGRRSTQTDRSPELATYSRVRAELKLAIRKAQESSWSELCRAVDSDPWGVPYRLVTKRLGRRTPTLERELTVNVARGLFPSPTPPVWEDIPLEIEVPAFLVDLSGVAATTPQITADEVSRAVARLPSGKAPGPDLVPNEIIRMTFNRFPGTFVECYNACLAKGDFPSRWKRAKLVLLHKGRGKPPDLPSSYRPISLLDGAGKVLERILLNRLEAHITGSRAISESQYGFRRSKSTTDAVEDVLGVVERANRGPVQNRHLCALISLDVRNAFNSAPWNLIDEALRRSAAPEYLIKVLRSYMHARSLVVDEELCIPVSCGVPQGSVLGPFLWNIFYDGVLQLPVREGIKIIAFADDIAVVAVAHNAELMEQLVNPTLEDIVGWMSSNGLRLAPEKSECVVLTRKHSFREPSLYIQGCQVPVKRSVRYLGIQLDTRLSFVEHASTVAAGAKKAATALARLMPNVGGPSQSKRSLLMSVVHSRLLYGAVIWSERVLETQKSKNLLLQAQRVAALRVARCYRTVSDMASLVLARMPPVTLQAASRRRTAMAKRTGATPTKWETTAETVRQWQVLWDATTKAEWTKRLIPDLSRWWYHGPNTISFHMAKALTGHGCFQRYLWQKKRQSSPECVHCRFANDDAEHTIFHCPEWEPARVELTRALRKDVRPEDVTYLLCGPDPGDLPDDPAQRKRLYAAASIHRQLFCNMVELIMGQKEEMERARQHLQRPDPNPQD